MSGPLQLEFVTSADRFERLPASRAEVAVVGRSNVGKSSLINSLANRKNLARVSNTPGRTRLLNLFTVDPEPGSDGALTATVMDLPGYGYAKASKQMRASWGQMIETYLLEREELVMVVVLVDGEVGPTKLDAQMLDWLRQHGLPHTVVATKHDKVKSSKRQRRKRDLADGCDLEPGDVVWVSAAKGTGVDRLRSLVRAWLTDPA
ncbi:MAG: ribosome biogenesis GTP-binding protein YihA/YsxC [Actinomycetota bacterium]